MTNESISSEIVVTAGGIPELPEKPHYAEQIGEAALKGIFGAIPFIGPTLAETIGLSMQASNEHKIHNFLEWVQAELARLQDISVLRIEDILDDVQFKTYVTRALWQSVETHEEVKLKALALAASHSGSWSMIQDAEREFYWRLLRKYNALHFKTLRALHPVDSPSGEVGSGPSLNEFFMKVIGFPAHHEGIGAAILADLHQDRLLANDYGMGYTITSGISHLSTLGGEFLNFVGETTASSESMPME